MAVYSLNFFDLSYVSTNNPTGFSDNGGFQFVAGTDTITLAPGANSSVLSIYDSANTTFDDDPNGTQVLNGAQTLNGTLYAGGTVIEAEYIVYVQDSLSNSYTLQFVSLSSDAWNIQGFVVQGPRPPVGEALTVTGTQDMVSGIYSYAGSTPSCFAAPTLLETEAGVLAAERLQRGIRLRLTNGQTAPIALVLRSTVTPAQNPALAPLQIPPHAFGPGLPARALLLSPHHRVAVPGMVGLVPVRLLAGLCGIAPRHDIARIDYVHVVLAHHAVVRAEGLGCESFWPGPVAMGSLPRGLQARVRRAMGPTPNRALPFQGRAAAERALCPQPARQ